VALADFAAKRRQGERPARVEELNRFLERERFVIGPQAWIGTLAHARQTVAVIDIGVCL
jgi:hypothetical protein